MPEHGMARFWDARAREDALYFVDNRRAYRDGDDTEFWSVGEHDLDQILTRLDLSINPDDRVLDIGCGPGRLTRAISARAAAVIGIDVSEEMLSVARELNGHLDNVTWLLGDGTSLAGVGDGAVDVAISHVVFHHIPDPRITLGYIAEIGRVLAPGGWAAIQVSNDPRIHLARRQCLRARLRTALGRAPSGQTNPAWLGSSVELDDLRATARSSGLAVERVLGEGSVYCLVRVRRAG